MNFTALAEVSQGKTRVVMLGIHPKLSEIIRYILDFHGKSYDFADEYTTENEGEDFFIIKTNDSEGLKTFQPTILFIGRAIEVEDYEPIISQITAGGILVFPNDIPSLDRVVLQSLNYFKKYEYSTVKLENKNEKTAIDTEFGKLEIPVSDIEILKDIEGAKYFCQQLGVMEDEFYDALSTWQ